MQDKLYTIGQMAKICNLTTEQLRHYDKNGVLSPNGRGRHNNYRYYTEQQIEDILLIKQLKRVGLPLKTIADLVRSKNLQMIKVSLESNMMIQRSSLYERLKSYDSLVDTLLSLNNAMFLISESSDGDLAIPAQRFSIVPIAERPIISTRYLSSYSVDDTFIRRYAELIRIIESEKVSTARSQFLLFHDHYQKQFTEGEDSVGDLELFFNVTGAVKNSPHCRMFGGFLAACAIHIGHYRNTKGLYDELTRWVTSVGYMTTGASFQELIVGRTMTGDEDNFVTKVYLPLNVSLI